MKKTGWNTGLRVICKYCLDFTQWKNFKQVIEKAKIACKNSGQTVEDHFADASKTIPMLEKTSKLHRTAIWINKDLLLMLKTYILINDMVV